MRNILASVLLFATASCIAQPRNIQLTNNKNGKQTMISEGNKVLLAIKIARHEARKKPLSAYNLSKNELADSVFVYSKGKIKNITDSSIIMKEKNSFFSSSFREIKLEKINTMKKLSFGKQVFRTTTTVAGGLAAGIAIFYSYVATGGGDGFIEGMFLAGGTAVVATRFGRTKISKKHLDTQEIRLARVNP